MNKPEEIRNEVAKQIKVLQTLIEKAEEAHQLYCTKARIEGLRAGLSSLILVSSKL